jgi:hypothetical protein
MIDRSNTDLQSRLQGLWLPLVTPFHNGVLVRRACAGSSGTTRAALSTD